MIVQAGSNWPRKDWMWTANISCHTPRSGTNYELLYDVKAVVPLGEEEEKEKQAWGWW